MSIRVEYIVDTAKGEANLKGLASAAEGMGQKSSRAQTELMKLTAEMERAQEQALRLNAKMLLGADVMQKAVTRMNDMHEEAVRMNASMKGTSDAATLMASNVGALGNIATSTASQLGASSSALGVLSGAGEVATVVMGGMTKAALGFNAATLGVIGAGLAIGVAIGSMIREISGVAKWLDEATVKAAKFFGFMQNLPKSETGASQAALNAAAKLKEIETQTRLGMVGPGMDNIAEFKTKAEKERSAAMKSAAEAQKAAAASAAAAQRQLVEAYRTTYTEAGRAAAVQKELGVIMAALGPLAGVSQKNIESAAGALTKMGTEGSAAAQKLIQDWLAAGNVFQIVSDKAKVAALQAGVMAGPSNPGKAAKEVKEVFIDVTTEIKDTKKTTEEWAVSLEDAASKVSGILNLVGAISQLPGAFAAATDSASAFNRALGGASIGGQLGGQVGDLVGKFFPKIAKLAGPIGEMAGSLIGGIAGLFKKPSWVKVGKDAGKVLGVEIGEEMAKQIEATAKKLNVSVKVAALLNLDQVIGDSGKSASSFAPQIMDLMKGIADGSIPAAEGMEQLNDAFARLVDEAESGSMAASKLMVQMLQLGRSTKTTTAEMKAFTDSSLKSAQDGVAAMIAANTIAVVSSVEKLKKDGEKIFKTVFDDDATMANAQAQGYIFAAAFWATAGEEGIVAAGRAFGDSWEAYKEQLREAEIDPEALAAITGPIDAVMSLFQNETTKGLLEGLDGATQAVKGLGDAGYMTQGAFDALGQQAGATFQALAGEGGEGVDPTVALQAIAPALAEVQRQSEMYGLTIDANTQSLIDQANAAGIAFPTDPLQAIVQILQETLDLMRQINGLPVDIKTNSPNVTVPNPNGNGFPVGPPQAEGGYTPANTPTWRLFGEGNEGEFVVPESKMGKMGGVTIGQGAVQVNLGDVSVSNGIELADLQAAIENGSAQGVITALKMAGLAA